MGQQKNNNALKALKLTGLFLAILWGVWGLDLINDTLRLVPDISRMGIIPRRPMGLLGILTSPFVHAGLFHLLSNTVPLFFLGFAMLYFYRRTAPEALTVIVLGGGFLVWIFGRAAIHIGASLVIFGMAAYLIASGLFRKRLGPIVLAIVVTLFYGTSLLWGLIPKPGPVSWEAHLSGALAGTLAAWLYRKTQY